MGGGSLVDIVHLRYLVQQNISHYWYDRTNSVSKNISNISFNSKDLWERIRHDEVCSAENIVTEKNNEVFDAWLNPSMSTQGSHWSSIIQKNPFLNRNKVHFCLGPYLDDNEREPDITVGGGLYANTDYYLPWHFQQPWYNPEDDFGSFKYYHFGQIKSVGSDRLDLTPNLVSDHGSTGLDYKIDSKLFFTELLNNLLDDWYWKTFKKSLWNMPDDASILSRVNQD